MKKGLGAFFVLTLSLATAFIPLSSKVWAESPDFEVQIQGELLNIRPDYLKHRVAQWISQHGEVNLDEIRIFIQDLYLQRGNPNIEVQLQADIGALKIQINENLLEPTYVESLEITGGSPLQRYITRMNLRQVKVGKLYNHAALKEDIQWIRENHFIPVSLQIIAGQVGNVKLVLDILSHSEIIPTGNISFNDITGVALTAGVIVDNIPENHLFRAMVKRNNLPIIFNTTHEVQDWEYVLTWSTGINELPGVTLGLNHYNKVDFIFPQFREQEHTLWIQSLGLDLYSGFPIWTDPRSRQYLRGVANLSLVQANYFLRENPQVKLSEISHSQRTDDLQLLPSLNLIYSNIDDYIIPRNGHLLRGRISGGFLDAAFTQGTFSAFSFWTPWANETLQTTLLLRNAVGTTFGLNPPFYLGFLNTGNWLVRGATEFSIAEKHALRTSQEFHLIYRPTPQTVDGFLYEGTGQTTQGFLDQWAYDANIFLDQGAYWRDNLSPQILQLSAGIGLNTITPAGTILGVDLATPIYPTPGGISVLLRINAPLTFTLYSDWINSNGFFLR